MRETLDSGASRDPASKRGEAPIGVFDSGLGGLTVFAALRERLPNENIVYLGDTARVPYGGKSPKTVARFAWENARFLVERGAKMIVVACNTVAATAMPFLRRKFAENGLGAPITDVLEAGLAAAAAAKPAEIAVLGTTATIASRAYESGIRALGLDINVKSIACPLFVPIVEEGLTNHEIAETAMNIYLSELRANPPDALLLGCTHYPLLKKAIEEYLPAPTVIIDSARSVAELVAKRLGELNIANSADSPGNDAFFATDSPADFAAKASTFLGRGVGSANLAVVDEHART